MLNIKRKINAHNRQILGNTPSKHCNCQQKIKLLDKRCLHQFSLLCYHKLQRVLRSATVTGKNDLTYHCTLTNMTPSYQQNIGA